MGDMKKRKTDTEMVEKVDRRESGSAGFAELRDDLFREAAKLVSEDPSTRIAIFVTPPPSESDVSIQTFGYPSAESVVQTFLEDKSPVPVAPEDAEQNAEAEDDESEDPPRQQFWWEDDKLCDSMNPEQLKAAAEKLMRLRNHLRLQLESRERAQVSGNQEDLHDDKAGPKP
ncbi:unnamed protein product [Microthlaspi erraticum]|uniref:MADS-box domain-containing protein n=1 Tax=Microthlaspi erraticum TaxID=1685480 RepID=A0A6D2HSR0_9BRAS|nr:unnamed protein product [Microthlaspi erraticum]